jgi:predicted RNA methylase
MMPSQAEIEAAAWYFCPHIPTVRAAGPNNVCDVTCGCCWVKAAAALHAAARIRQVENHQQLSVAMEIRSSS